MGNRLILFVALMNLDYAFSQSLSTPNENGEIVIKDFLEKKSLSTGQELPGNGPIDGKLSSESSKVLATPEKKFRGYALNFFVGPLEIEKISKTQNITLGMAIDDFNPAARISGGEARLTAKRRKRTSPYDNEESTFSRYQAEGSYFFNKVLGELDIFSFLQLEREEDEQFIPIHKRILFGIVGIKFNFMKDKEFQELSLGYAPLYETNDYDRIDNGRRLGHSKDNFIRHLLQLQFKSKIWENVAFKSVFRWKPKHDIKEKNLKQEIQIRQDLLIYPLSYLKGSLFHTLMNFTMMFTASKSNPFLQQTGNSLLISIMA